MGLGDGFPSPSFLVGTDRRAFLRQGLTEVYSCFVGD